MSLIAQSHVDTERREFIWNINNFHFLSSNQKYLEQHVFPFTVGSSIGKPSKWRLFFKQDFHPSNVQRSAALFFQMVDYTGTDEIPVSLKVTVDSGPYHKYEFKMAFRPFTEFYTRPVPCNMYWYGRNTSNAWYRITPEMQTLQSICNRNQSDALQLNIVLTVFGKQSFTISEGDLSPSAIMAREQANTVRRQREAMFAMLENGERSDVTFETRDDQRIAAHRCILSMQSTVFAAMFAAEMKEKTDGVVKLVDMGGEGLKILLKFLYTCELEETWCKFYDEIVNAANKYQIKSLMDTCDKMLPTLVSWENCVELLNLSELHGMTGAKEKITKFMQSDPARLFELLRAPPSSKRRRDL